MTSDSNAPLTRRQLRELEANGQFPAPKPAAPAQPPHAEPSLLASLPLLVEASATELVVDGMAGEEPTGAAHSPIEASIFDDTVAAAPADDPFLASLFSEPTRQTPVVPDAIPLASDTVQGLRKVGRSRVRRRRVAARPAAADSQAGPAASAPGLAGAGRVRSKHRPASKLFTLAAMLFSGALFVGMSVPANAFISFADDTGVVTNVATVSGAVQKVAVAADAAVDATARDSFTVTSYAEILKEKYGTRVYTFSPTTGAVRWPFPYATPISSGFGDRVAPCLGCSSHHNGVDFTPGIGTPIYAIADGVVTESEMSGSFGQHVYMDNGVINGQKISSIYGHMLAGSSPLVTGQSVKVGDFIGLVGSTGSSTGAHLHLEVHVDGVPVDPFAWLQANAVN